MQHQRVLSGMRPTGRLHLGHYHGVLKNWVKLQYEYDCFFAVADLHALTTHFDDSASIEENVWEMVVDWLTVGVNPGYSCMFIQSKVPEHAELQLLLAMITPLGWLERVPSYKDQQLRLKDRDLSSYGFLGYPLLQSADILLYKSGLVPVGEDQVSHVEFTREVARRFNHIFGKDKDFSAKAQEATKKLGKKQAKIYEKMRKLYQEQGEQEALEKGQALLEHHANLTLDERERLYGYLEGSSKLILPEPKPMLTATPKMPGLDGQKMSKSYNNTINIREHPDSVSKKIRTMPTDPARIRRSDPGDPDKCPVWPLHEVYSDDEVKAWVCQGCRSAAIGCLDCKQPLIDAVNKELAPLQQRAEEFENNVNLVKGIIAEGCDKARDLARTTMSEVKEAMGLDYR